MRALRLLLVPLMCLGIAGCVTVIDPGAKSILEGGPSITAPIANPFGLNEQYQVEATVATARRLAVSYFSLRQCRASETASLTNPCARRSVKVTIQSIDRKVGVAL